jgi:lipopolysaccharide/colanic/teichoic acid biosynthesis glycosyltransferase
MPRFVTQGPLPWLVASGKSSEAETDRALENYHSNHSFWSLSIWKRAFDLACVIPALILLSPLMGIIALAVRLTSSGPIIFHQQRTGQHRKLFTIFKFRTMVDNSEGLGPAHTAKGDPRIIPIGHFLRRFKLDELPQLYNVLRGEMTLVGPRPKLPDHEHTSMTCLPGITGAATLAFRHEARILCNVPSEYLDTFYRDHIIPLKMKLDADYMQTATLISDVRILCATVLRIGTRLTHEDLLQSKSRVTPISGEKHLILFQ